MRAAAIAVALVFPALAWANDDHLFPEQSSFLQNSSDIVLTTEYDRDLVTVLHEAFAPEVTVRAVYGGSTVVAEQAIGLREDKTGAHIFALSPDENLFAFAELADWKAAANPDTAIIAEQEAELPKSLAEVTVTSCDMPVDAKLASDVEALWDIMLRQTRYRSAQEAANLREIEKGQTIVEVHIDQGFPIHYSNSNMAGMSVEDGPKVHALDAVAMTIAKVCNREAPESALRSAVATALALVGEEAK